MSADKPVIKFTYPYPQLRLAKLEAFLTEVNRWPAITLLERHH